MAPVRHRGPSDVREERFRNRCTPALRAARSDTGEHSDYSHGRAGQGRGRARARSKLRQLRRQGRVARPAASTSRPRSSTRATRVCPVPPTKFGETDKKEGDKKEDEVERRVERARVTRHRRAALISTQAQPLRRRKSDRGVHADWCWTKWKSKHTKRTRTSISRSRADVI